MAENEFVFWVRKNSRLPYVEPVSLANHINARADRKQRPNRSIIYLSNDRG
jgi:hypothetical protein